MADDLGAAPQTGDSGTTTVADAPATTDKGAPKEPVLSAREAINKAMATVEIANPPDETAKAAAVLKRGAGADDKLVADHQKTIQRAADDEVSRAERTERATKGWETRRANAEKAEKEVAAPASEKAIETKSAEAVKDAPAPKPVEAPKPEPSKYRAPERMSAEGKAAWEAAPEPLRAEVVRMHDEMTNGLTKHKEGADRWAEMADFDKLAKEQGTTVKDALNNYIALDKRLGTDLYGGLDDILKYHGTNLREVAEKYLAEEPETIQASSRERELVAEINSLKKQVGDVTKHVETARQTEQQRHQTAIEQQVESFWKDNPKALETADDIVIVLSSPKFQRSGDPVADLKRAFEMTGGRAQPASAVTTTPAPAIPEPDLTAQTRKGTASVSGAPAMGSNPSQKRPVPTSARDAINMAMRQTGVA